MQQMVRIENICSSGWEQPVLKKKGKSERSGNPTAAEIRGRWVDGRGGGGVRTIQLLHNAVRQAGVVWAQGFSAKCSRNLRSSARSSCSAWSGAPSVFTGRSTGLEETTAHNRPTTIPLLKLYWLPPPLFCFYLFSRTRQLDFFKLILGWERGPGGFCYFYIMERSKTQTSPLLWK